MKRKILLILVTLSFMLCIAFAMFNVSYADTGISSPFQYVTVCVDYVSALPIVLLDTDTDQLYTTVSNDSERHFVDLPYSAFGHIINVVVYLDVAQSGVDPNGYNVPYVDSVYSFAPNTDITNSQGTAIAHSDTSFILLESTLRDGRWCLVRLRDTLRVSTVGSILSDNRELERELSSVTADRDYLQGLISSQDKPSEMVSFLGGLFYEVGTFFQIELFPNITIGTIVAIPLIFGAIFLVLHFVRGS